MVIKINYTVLRQIVNHCAFTTEIHAKQVIFNLFGLVATSTS